LTSVAYQGSTTPNDFSAKWDGSALFTQTNLDAFGWTNLQFVVSATSASSTLEFDFNEVPGAFGLDDVRVETVPAPVAQSASISGGMITFTLGSVANVSYQIQSASDLSNPTWTDVGPPVIASGDQLSVSEPVSGGSQQFYRVIMVLTP
jgi:hypothetical protein